MLDFIKLIDEEISDFDKSTFDVKDHLAPEVWETEDNLHAGIRNTLIKIAKDFFDNLDLEGVDIDDVIITGSLANYNWSEYSDIDLHIVLDFNEIDENTELVKQFFNAKKNIWNRTHEILIKGYEVEIYVQDKSEPHTSTGIFSLMQNTWLVRPSIKAAELNWDDITLKVESFMAQADDLKEMFDKEQSHEVFVGAERLLERIKNFRKAGLESGGEFSVENIAFKVLRRTGVIGDLMELKNDAYDRHHSIDSSEPTRFAHGYSPSPPAHSVG